MVAPCLNCAERTQGCHATCEAYARWRKSFDIIAAEQRKRYNDDALAVLAEYAKKAKAERYRRRRK